MQSLNAAPERHRAGFTLIEILVGVAILAILSAALTPLVIKYVNDGRRARALSDSQILGQAIRAFNLDTGIWPVSSDGNINDGGEVSRLVGLPAGFGGADIPNGANVATGDDNWDGGGSGGAAQPIEDHLIFNRTATVDPLYPVSASPPQPPGWNGPYLDRVPLDPWGRPFVCNVRYLQNANVNGTTQAERDQHAVWCLSAGPNGVWETAFDDGTEIENNPGGDDIGAVIQGNRNRN
ncbi:MAG: prepilin-type N-terminal cleavage/methylation domain-containing protein [Myxococcota bacterium]